MKKKFLIIFFAIVLVLNITGCGKKKENKTNEENDENNNQSYNEKLTDGDKISIFDVNSNDRPLAIVVNNTPIAVQVQEGLNKAYIVYEIPTEGGTSRLMGIFKDVPDLKVGTIRSARHNFADFAFESDAILVAYGWSIYAEAELKNNGIINNINGIVEGPFWRENPLDLPYEHTAYTSIAQLKDYARDKGYSLESDNSLLLKYSVEEVNLDNMEGVIPANVVTLPYGNINTKFVYDQNSKMYTKIVNDVTITDFATSETFTTKNIIVEKINYGIKENHYYLDLYDVGSGDGYYITNGHAVPIKWSKETRQSKTKYTYLDGNEIDVNDGRTYIEVQLNDYPTYIE